MTYQKRPTCGYCHCAIRICDSYGSFLMPRPNGEVRMVTFHGRCIERFNRLATTKLYSEIFEKKRKAHLRTQGVYVA